MNRVKIKEKARKIIKGNLWNFWKPFLVYFLISFLCGFFISLFVVPIFNLDDNSINVVSLISEILLIPLTYGIVFYVMNLVRGKKYNLKDLKKYYKYFVPCILVTSLMGIFVFLWSCLLIIPGIIAGISYSMVAYIFIDQDQDALNSIKSSKKLMYGYKWDYTKFILSFLGWILLGALTFGILYIWVIPYLMTSEIIYYDELKKINS